MIYVGVNRGDPMALEKWAIPIVRRDVHFDPTVVTSAKVAVPGASLLSFSVGLAVIARAGSRDVPESRNTDAHAGAASTQREIES